jgi:hypothetical protein
LVVEAVQTAAHAARLGASPALDALTFVIGVVGAFVIAAVVAKHRATAWLNG